MKKTGDKDPPAFFWLLKLDCKMNLHKWLSISLSLKNQNLNWLTESPLSLISYCSTGYCNENIEYI